MVVVVRMRFNYILILILLSRNLEVYMKSIQKQYESGNRCTLRCCFMYIYARYAHVRFVESSISVATGIPPSPLQYLMWWIPLGGSALYAAVYIAHQILQYNTHTHAHNSRKQHKIYSVGLKPSRHKYCSWFVYLFRVFPLVLEQSMGLGTE
jgi:hypothetical protein